MTIFPEDQSQKQRVLDQAKDTGMAFVLLSLVVWLITRHDIAVVISIGILLLTMAVPKMLIPVSALWFGFSRILGMVMSKILLVIIFLAFVVPVGTIRKWAGKDTLQLHAFKKKRSSGFIDRNHRYGPHDLLKPY